MWLVLYTRYRSLFFSELEMDFTNLKDKYKPKIKKYLTFIFNVLLPIFDIGTDLYFTYEMGMKADWYKWNLECICFIFSCKYIFWYFYWTNNEPILLWIRLHMTSLKRKNATKFFLKFGVILLKIVFSKSKIFIASHRG